ncbi:glycosyl hydrolase family 28 protein [Mucilaginibacter terrae]|uniref:Endo-polygalacturonase n=1 Tax=Mucilaginibacter terrae TaxID=1955052 RepID=A0ABU3GMX7_9SPHI|nr:glycosyl hydrolase family 28 protein [Mucilaginibacter terrae]MDT3401144.1 hypothetical protein [Mucilaginibacter terrae]
MKRSKIFILLLLLLFTGKYAKAKLLTYPVPLGIIKQSAFSIRVREALLSWQPIEIYSANVAKTSANHFSPVKTSFGYFDCDNNVEIEVTVKNYIKSARVSPAKYGIVPQIKNNKIVFLLKPGQKISLEINGDIYNNLQLFANQILDKEYVKTDTSLIYFGPGIHNLGRRRLNSNETLYIAGGAVVYGSLIIDHAENVKICGTGILAQLEDFFPNKFLKHTKVNPLSIGERADQILISFSKNVTIDGICVLPHKYSVLIGNSDGVTIQNFKAFSFEGNADGIDIFCSKNINISHIFMRNSDDCIAVYGHRWGYYGNTSNVNVNDAALWADVAHPILIGTHGDSNQPDTLERMRFSDLSILNHHENQLDYQGCIALNAGDDNLIRDITFENVNVERISKGQLINLRVINNRKYNTSPGNRIENILFKNLHYSGLGVPLSIFTGYDSTRNIRNIVFVNLKIGNKVISDTMDGKPSYYKTGDMANIFWSEHVQNVSFITN